jgi:hypothetical protein
MGLSETVVAAIIGAIATMLTAIFQLVRNSAPRDTRPKKNRVRSVLATTALMIGAIVGGYFWAVLRQVNARDEMRADLKAELDAQFAQMKLGETKSAMAGGTTVAAHPGQAGTAESIVHLPPCRVTSAAEDAGPTTCTDALATNVSLCALVPAAAQTKSVRLHARVPKSESPWLERDAGATTLGSLHIAAETNEYPASPDTRSVCLDVANYSVDETLAVRLAVDYGFGPAPGELTASAPTGTTL